MWKLNKSIAKELLPAEPADLAIEPWWGVRFVNFTLEEFKVRSIHGDFYFCRLRALQFDRKKKKRNTVLSSYHVKHTLFALNAKKKNTLVVSCIDGN
jgi:hypothetical protein